MTVRAGRLRNSLNFYTRASSKSANGEQVTEYRLLGSARAERLSSTVNRGQLLDGDETSHQVAFRLRFNRQLLSAQFLEYNQQKLEVFDIDNVGGLDRELIISARRTEA